MRHQRWLLAAWGLAGFIILLSLSLILLYGLNFNHVKILLWFTSFLIAVAHKSLVIDPIRISVTALLTLFETKKPPPDYKFRTEITPEDERDRRRIKSRLDYLMSQFRNEKWKIRNFCEPRLTKETEEQIINYNMLVIDLLMFTFYLITLLLIVLGSKDYLAYYSTRYVRDYFLSGKYNGPSANMILTDRDLIDFINKTVILNVNRGRLYNGVNITDSHGWSNNKVVKILGVARLRQHRIRSGDCTVPKRMQPVVRKCSGSFHPGRRDQDDHVAKWKPKFEFSYSKKYWRITDPWKYKSSLQTRTLPIFGTRFLYPGGGYTANLGRNYNNSRRVLEFLIKNDWINERTGVVFIEFTLYSADTNLFNIVTIVAERNPFGSYIVDMKVKSVKLLFILSHMPWYAFLSFIIFVVMIGIFFYRLILNTISLRRKGFSSNPWNFVDTILIALSGLILIIFFVRNGYVVSLLEQLEASRNNEFVSFYFAAICDDFYTWMAALLVCLATIRLWRILHFALVFRVLTRTLYRSARSIAATMTLIFIFLIGFSIVVHLINGRNSSRFSKFLNTVTTLLAFNAQLPQEFDPKELQYGGKVLGILIYGIQAIVVNIFLLNMLITITCNYFSELKDELNKQEVKNYTFWSFLRDEFDQGWRDLFYKTNKTTEKPSLRLRGGGGRKSKFDSKIAKDSAGTKLTRIDYTNEKATLVNEIINTQMDYVDKFIDEQLGKVKIKDIQESQNVVLSEETKRVRKTDQEEDLHLNGEKESAKNDGDVYRKRTYNPIKLRGSSKENSIRTL